MPAKITESDKTEAQSSSDDAKGSAKEFLLSIAGMFDSGKSDSSQNVKPLVAEAIEQKYRQGHNEDHR